MGTAGRNRKQFHIGTSGWHYKHWVGNFYPAKTASSKMLSLYAEHFDSVELNNTFYRLPAESSVENWRESTPRNFHFAVKGSRYLTHMLKLREPEQGLKRYFERVDLLGHKLGPVLFQLPPHWGLDLDRFRIFLEALPRHHRYAFEFRDRTWHDPRVFGLLRKFEAAWCIFDLDGSRSPVEVTTDFAYVRLHGPGKKYVGTYTESALREWVDRARKWKVKKAYFYFDNTEGRAVENALQLKEMLKP